MRRRQFLLGVCGCGIIGVPMSPRAENHNRTGFICTSTYDPPSLLSIAYFSTTERREEVRTEFGITNFGVASVEDRWRPEHSLTSGSKITLGICYLDGTKSDQDFISDVAKGWLRDGLNDLVDFDFSTPPENSHIRISIDPTVAVTNSSKIGPDAHFKVPFDKPTMKLFDRDNPWTIEHEFGHALCLQHEHQFPGGISFEEDAVVEDLKQHMNLKQIRENVIQAFEKEYQCVGDPELNEKSVMMYEIPSHWTTDGKTYAGNSSISDRDIACLRAIYSL